MVSWIVKKKLDISEYEGSFVIFDDMLDYNQYAMDPFFTRGSYEDIIIYYFSQSYFGPPKRTIRNNSNIILLYQQFLEDVENFYRDNPVFDMSYEKWKFFVAKPGKMSIINFFDRSNNKSEGKYRIRNESEPERYFECIPETNPFWKLKTNSST